MPDPEPTPHDEQDEEDQVEQTTMNGQRTAAAQRMSKAAAKGDVYVGSMAAEVRQVPGSRTVNGQKAVSRIVDTILDRARRRIRQRRTAQPPA